MSTIEMAKSYVLENDRLRVEVATKTFSVNVADKETGQEWRMKDETFDEVVVERSGAVSKKTLAGSESIEARLMGKRGLLFDFRALRLQLLISLDGAELAFELIPGEENERFRIKGVCYPRAFELTKSGDCCLVVPFAQGVMIPGDWPEEAGFGEIWPFGDEERLRTFGELFNMDVEWWSSYRPGYAPALANNMLMPWWGAVERKGSVLIVLDEDSWADSYLIVEHPPAGPTSWRLLWLPSRGRMGYPRRVTYRFLKGDYVALAKGYRKVAESRGKCVTLAGKRERNPNMDKLVGAANMRVGFLRHSYQRFEHAVLLTFAKAAELIEDFHRRTGIEKLHIRCRSWQQHGHDIQYPDLVPPAPEAGGPVEFEKLASRARSLGYAFGLGGDNYHDVAADSPLFSESMLLRYADGSTNRRNFWASGLTSLICTSVALKYIRRNFEIGRTDYPATKGLLETARPDTYWIGNYVSSYECYDPRHPMTRNTCWDAQREIFSYITSKGLLLNNEHPKDWAAPYFYMARTRQARKGIYGYDRSGDVIGVPIPLWSLVHHDCLMTSGDNFLLQLMNGSPPTIALDAADDKELVARTRLHAAVQAAVMFDEMVTHEFTAEGYGSQRTEFSSGVSVWVDESKERFRVSGVAGVVEKEFDAGEIGKHYY